ncbi:MAG: S41 family peptidase [Phycisphaerae bacterium]
MLVMTIFLALFMADEVAYPTTAPGRTAAAFVAAYNSGQNSTMRTFEAEFRSTAGPARTIEQRLEMFGQLRERLGDLRPLRLGESTGHELVLIAQPASGDEPISMRFQCEAEPPHKLMSILIGPVGVDATPISSAERSAAIDEIVGILERQYVFPDKVPAMAERLRSKQKAGEYDKLNNTAELAERWTQDLQVVCGDKHLRVRVAPSAAAQLAPDAPRERPGAGNYGFKRVEVLPGNIGYIKLDGFSGDEHAQAPAAAAMAFVRGCDHLIFDLRENGGGSPVMIQFLQSYLFEKRTHLNSFRDREGTVVEESWTTEMSAAERPRSSVPVYVLISSRTFSGAEEFSYNLQTRGRATIIGETSGGGAHPVRPARVGKHFILGVPFQRAENPITKTNWEGVGIVPDLKVPASEALDVATSLARGTAPSGASKSPASSTSENAAIERAVLDYCEAFLENKPEYLERSVDRTLKKFGYSLGRDGQWRMHAMTFDQATELAAKYKRRDPNSPKKVEVLDVRDRIASATLIAEWGMDHVHLHKVDDRWKIVHVVWQSLPDRAATVTPSGSSR